ncbi:MAG: M3 family oligoendopeptidase, partial [Candidatus Omnitrophica bacterium]|nr:M3 family oligoendopeptidase [Candidatus Omnitrophota bacterium]
LHRFDYTPEQCKQYHTTVEKTVVPLWKRISERRRDTMNLDRLRPWDGSVDPLGREPLKPFSNVEDLISGCERIFDRVDPDFGRQFNAMARDGLLDLSARKGKAPGGYQSSLDEARRPFVFMNAVGLNSDVFTLLHEGGHSFHTLACADHPLVDYRHGPMEFNEVASMAMELLAAEHLEEFYSDEDKQRAKNTHFEDVIFILPWVAVIDSFQHWIYENPEHSRDERREKWLEILHRLNGGVTDWTGLEEVEACLWHRQLHIFEVPFYYIEYGIAQIGALQVWRNAKRDGVRAIKDYKKGLALGGARPLPEIYQRAGIEFKFTEDIIGPLMEAVGRELNLD